MRSIASQFLILASCLLLPAAAQDFEQDPINYSTAAADNPVSRLEQGLDAGSVALEYDERFGYLRALLAHLGIPESSQVLVFSKTSLQTDLISPETPRAIYFNDDTYIGRVHQGRTLEISTADPVLGAVFYTLDEQPEAPKLTRQSHTCMQCHAGSLTGGNPGHMVRSVYPAENGFPLFRAGTHLTTQDSPFSERWGGWYVTGTHGDARHMGNVFARETPAGAEMDLDAGANVTALPERVNPANYLTPHSDIVALMVLEHQAQMHNLMTAASFDTRRALRDQAVMDDILQKTDRTLSESTQRRIASAGDRLLRYMLFIDEPALESPVAGTSPFAEEFQQRGPRDSMGRSLRDLDLTSRLFKYPLSYLIYSEQFDALPLEMRQYLYQRLWTILSSAPRPGDGVNIDAETRRALIEIVRETKADLPAPWRED